MAWQSLTVCRQQTLDNNLWRVKKSSICIVITFYAFLLEICYKNFWIFIDLKIYFHHIFIYCSLYKNLPFLKNISYFIQHSISNPSEAFLFFLPAYKNLFYIHLCTLNGLFMYMVILLNGFSVRKIEHVQLDLLSLTFYVLTYKRQRMFGSYETTH